MKFDETYTTIDKFYEIFFAIIFGISFVIVIIIFGIPLLIVRYKEKKRDVMRGNGN